MLNQFTLPINLKTFSYVQGVAALRLSPPEEKFMKTKILFVISLSALVMACATQAPEVYDVSVPAEKLCTLEIAQYLVVKKFDGNEVNWAAPGLSTWKRIQISEGLHEFVMDYDRYMGTGMNMTSYSADNIEVRYDNFLAGHTYRIYAAQGAEILLGGMMYNKKQESGQMVLLSGSPDALDDNSIMIYLEDITR
jgi:hypothetical protein